MMKCVSAVVSNISIELVLDFVSLHVLNRFRCGKNSASIQPITTNQSVVIGLHLVIEKFATGSTKCFSALK